MERAQRIARINMLLKRPNGVTMAKLIEDLEVSRATVCRDIELMRNQMNAPIIWDPDSRSYCLEDVALEGPTYMVPGMWLTPIQAYAYLTLHNMVEQIAPNLLGPFLHPMRSLLKEMLGGVSFPLHGLDQKIEIEMPAMPKLGDKDFGILLEALVHNRIVLINIITAPQQVEEIIGMPLKLKITPDKWVIQVQIESTKKTVIIEADAIQGIKAQKINLNDTNNRS